MSNGKPRSTSLTVLGVINIVLGILGICGGLWGIASAFLPGAGQFEMPPETKALMTFLQACGLALSVLLLVAGIGLMMVKGWGRWLSIIYAIIDIPVTLVSSVITSKVVLPMIEQQAGGQLPPEAIKIIAGASMGFGLCCGLIYPIVLLIMLNLRDVKAAFGPTNPPPVTPQ